MSELSVVITGGLHGVGASIVDRFAHEQCRISIIANAKSADMADIQSRFSGYRKMGSEVRVIPTDIMDDAAIHESIQKAANAQGGAIDVCVNAALISQPMSYHDTTIEKLDLFYQVNARSSYSMMRAALASLRRSPNPHVLNIAPPINLDPRVMGYRTAYTVTQYFRSMLTVSLANAEEWRGVACNALWPVKPFLDGGNLGIYQSHIDLNSGLRRMALFSEAAYGVVTQPADRFNGEFFYDEEVLDILGVSLCQFDAEPQLQSRIDEPNYNMEHTQPVADALMD